MCVQQCADTPQPFWARNCQGGKKENPDSPFSFPQASHVLLASCSHMLPPKKYPFSLCFSELIAAYLPIKGARAKISKLHNVVEFPSWSFQIPPLQLPPSVLSLGNGNRPHLQGECVCAGGGVIRSLLGPPAPQRALHSNKRKLWQGQEVVVSSSSHWDFLVFVTTLSLACLDSGPRLSRQEWTPISCEICHICLVSLSHVSVRLQSE